MNVFVHLLGWLLIMVTFIGCFRLAMYLSRPTDTLLYPGLIATTLTVAFVIIVDVIILFTGLLAVTIPAAVLLRVLGVHSYSLTRDILGLDRDTHGQDGTTLTQRLSNLRTWIARRAPHWPEDPGDEPYIEFAEDDLWDPDDQDHDP